ncbi:MAG: hypothetical protein JWM33_4005, partial [Caulobacteraceae bacterium]|nr:hypothetical protein [Caulobacteraceae bacterium]
HRAAEVAEAEAADWARADRLQAR